jgi:hypothetical protein
MFAAWMIGFLLLMAIIVWVTVVIGLPQPVLGLVVLVLVAVGGTVIAVAVRRTRRARR